MLEEKTYLFNPFNVKKWSEEQIQDQVEFLIKKYDPDASTMYQLSLDAEIIANIMYLYGEMIARLTEKAAIEKNKVDAKEAKLVYSERKKWNESNSEKAPAMSYFEALASDLVRDDREEQYKCQSSLARFKYAYDSFEQKINAIKKKMESIRYEEFNK